MMQGSDASSEDEHISRPGLGGSTITAHDDSPSRPLSPQSSDSQLSSASEDFQDQKSGLPSVFGGAKARVRKRRRAQSPPSTGKHAKWATTDPSKWERHTRGIGSRILAKHGFTGRLGKRGDGITAPIQPIFRPEKLGLGAGGFSEKGDVAEVNDAIEKQDKETVHSGHQRNKQYNLHLRESAFEKVIDMREALPHEVHSVSVVLQSAQKATDIEQTEVADRLFAAPELLYNLQMLTDIARAEVAKAKRRRYNESLIAQAAERETDKGKAEREEASRALAYMSEMMNLFDRFTSIRNTAHQTVFATCVKEMVNIQKLAVQESFVSTQLVTAALVEIVSKHIEEQMLECLLKSTEQGRADKKQVRDMYRILAEIRNVVDPVAYTKLCTRAILMPLRRHVSRPAWDVVRGASIGDILSWMRRILPEALLTIFAEEVLVPRLLNRLQTDHASTLLHAKTEVPVHVWIHPWLPATGRNSMVEVIHRVRVALSKSLQEWKPGGSTDNRTELVGLVRSWSKVLSHRKLQLALARHITPKLGRRLIFATQGGSGEHDARRTLEEIAAWADVGSVRLLAKDLNRPFLSGPGGLIQKAALADSNWTKAKDIYLFWTQGLPRRLKDYMQPALAGLLFVLHSARVVKDPIMRRRLQREDVGPLLKNVFEGPMSTESHKETIRSRDIRKGRETRKARLVDVLELVGEREGLTVVGLDEERGMRVFRLGAARVVVDVERNVFVVGGRVADVEEIVRIAKSG